MAKSLVDKYEQILAQDPASTVFVELAKALLEKGEHARAIEVCQRGTGHHPTSIVGRVLWGKALINLGRPAEAMEQFDAAIGIDRENPHAYNLIGEVLLHKGLYRSALPLLRKAVALQPDDGRVRQWLEQTQAALAGGPAPVLSEPTQVDLPALAEGASVPVSLAPGASPLGEGAEAPKLPLSDDEPATDVFIGVVPAPVEPASAAAAPVSPSPPSSPAEDVPLDEDADRATDPFAKVPKRTESSDVIGGLTSTFDALSARGQTGELPLTPEPSISVSEDLLAEAQQRSSGLLPELSTNPENPLPSTQPSGPPVLAPVSPASGPQQRKPAGASRGGGGFLDDIPELPEPTSSLEVPKVEVSSQAAEAIAREYERELRQKLELSRADRSFFQKHWPKLAGGVLAALAVVLGTVVFLDIREQREATLRLLGEARRGIYQDTRASLTEALGILDGVLAADPQNADAHALSALANAVLFAEHGADAAKREKALSSLAAANVEAKHPAAVIVARYHVADGVAGRVEAGRAAVASELRDADLHELAGRVLLADGQAEAGLKRLQAALEAQAGHVRALVSLGDHFRGAGQHARALEFYAAAKDVSERHPARALGAAESRLELGEGLEESLVEVEALPQESELPEPQRARRALALGRLYAATGSAERGVELLTDGAARYPQRAYDFQLALGQAWRRAGRMAEAERALALALEQRPRSEEAREALARVLIDRDRPREALSKAPADADSRRISLVRAAAYAKLGQWKSARTELERTRVGGRYPTEAVIQLALADAAEGEVARAQEALEKTLAVARKSRSEVLVALAKVHQQKGELDKARQRYEEAAKETDDVEGACAFGRMLLSLGLPDLAVEPLSRSVERNDSHEEAHAALVQSLVMLGQYAQAAERAEKWTAATGTAASLRARAQTLLQTGQPKDALKPASSAIKKESKDPGGWRLRAAVHFANGDGKAAFRDLEQANRLNSKDAATFCEIGLAFLRQGNAEHAGAAFDAAVRENAELPCGKTGATYARLFGGKGAKPSLKDADALVKDAPTAADRGFAQTVRARTLLGQGKLKDAREAAEDAAKQWAWSGEAHLVRGLVLQRLKDEGAGEALAKAVAVDPAHGPARVAYADYLAAGTADERARAVDEYERFLQIGGAEPDVARVKRVLPELKRELASR